MFIESAVFVGATVLLKTTAGTTITLQISPVTAAGLFSAATVTSIFVSASGRIVADEVKGLLEAVKGFVLEKIRDSEKAIGSWWIRFIGVPVLGFGILVFCFCVQAASGPLHDAQNVQQVAVTNTVHNPCVPVTEGWID